MNVIGSGRYRSFIREAPTPVSFRRIHSAFLFEAPLRAFTPSLSSMSALNYRQKETSEVSPRSLILSVDPHHPTGLDKTSLVGL